MTLPPGLQAVRERADGRVFSIYIRRDELGRLVDLIETLAGAAEHLRNTDGHEGVDWDASENLKAQQELDAALDKYREFK